MNQIRMLFLAFYAPKSSNELIPSNIEDKTYAAYHYKLYQVLNENFPNLISSNDPSILFNQKLDIEYIFSLYNRMPFRNSEIFISSLAEYHRIPYLGARPNIRALAEDKHLAKMLSEHVGVPTPLWKIYNIGDSINSPNFCGPYFVKPRFGASSRYIDEASICSTWDSAKKRILYLNQNGLDALLEQQIDGIYYSVPILNNFGKHFYLPCIEELSDLTGNVVTYYQKRKITNGLHRSVLKDNTIEKQLNFYSQKMFELIQPLDYTRFDFIVDRKSGIPYFIEFNVCCNLGEHSSINLAAQSIGIKYEDLIMNITYSSLARNGLVNDTFGKNF